MGIHRRTGDGLLLLYGEREVERPPDSRHPLGQSNVLRKP